MKRELLPISLMDRLSAYFHWNDMESLEQAMMVVRSQDVDISEIKEWSEKEGELDKFNSFLTRIKK